MKVEAGSTVGFRVIPASFKEGPIPPREVCYSSASTANEVTDRASSETQKQTSSFTKDPARRICPTPPGRWRTMKVMAIGSRLDSVAHQMANIGIRIENMRYILQIQN